MGSEFHFAMELGYWNIRGLAQPIRLLLAYVGEEYEETSYECGGPPSFDRSSWTEVRNHIGLTFPGLPYLIDGETRLSQSNAIMRYIAEKHGLHGTDAQSRGLIDMLCEQLCALREEFTRLCYNPDFSNLHEGWLEALPSKLIPFEKCANNRSGRWLAGEDISWVDFIAYELFDQIKTLEPNAFTSFPNITTFIQKIRNLEQIDRYMSSERCITWPINNKMATWGGDN